MVGFIQDADCTQGCVFCGCSTAHMGRGYGRAGGVFFPGLLRAPDENGIKSDSNERHTKCEEEFVMMVVIYNFFGELGSSGSTWFTMGSHDL